VVGSERYNSLFNGRSEFPVVADPKGFDLNRVYLEYATDTRADTFGRQRINHGDQRFVGGVGWRQNEQTYDGVRATLTGRLGLDYSYVNRVNRIFGPDDGIQPRKWKSNSHFFRAELELGEAQTVAAYGYLMDFDNDNGPVNSNATLGIDYAGSFGPLRVAAAYARQSDYADSPLSYDAWRATRSMRRSICR
jgi:hypothetical protein